MVAYTLSSDAAWEAASLPDWASASSPDRDVIIGRILDELQAGRIVCVRYETQHELHSLWCWIGQRANQRGLQLQRRYGERCVAYRAVLERSGSREAR